jgi:hypothetical protein
MTRVCYTFSYASEKKDKLSKKKRRVGCLRSCVQRVVVMGKSMVGLEGKYKGWEKVWRVLVVYGDRGYTYEWLVKRVGN